MSKIYEIFVKILLVFVPSKTRRKKIKKKLLGRRLFGNFGSCYNEIKLKKDSICSNLNNAETVFIGSSHLAFGVNPKYISKNSYNLAGNSQDLFTGYSLLKYYIDILPNLKNVVIGYDVFTRGWTLDKTSAKHICSIYNCLYNVDYANKNYEKNHVKKCEKYSKMKLNNSKNSNGFLYPSGIPCSESAQDRAEGHLREWRRTPDRLEWLEKSIALGKGGIKFYILICPLRADVRDLLPDYNTLLGELEKYDAKIISFFDDKDFEFDDFYDYDHLNSKGARKLSGKLKEIIL